MNGYNQYLRYPSGSVIYRGDTGLGREVQEDGPGGWVAETCRGRKNDEKGQGWAATLCSWKNWKRRGDLKDSAGKESAGVDDKLDAEGEGGESKITLR